jgi:hypothetical protein
MGQLLYSISPDICFWISMSKTAAPYRLVVRRDQRLVSSPSMRNVRQEMRSFLERFRSESGCHGYRGGSSRRRIFLSMVKVLPTPRYFQAVASCSCLVPLSTGKSAAGQSDRPRGSAERFPECAQLRMVASDFEGPFRPRSVGARRMRSLRLPRSSTQRFSEASSNKRHNI